LSSPLTPLTPQGSVTTTKYLVRVPTAYINGMLQHVWFFSTLMQETVDAGDAERVTTQSSTTRKRRVSIAKVVLPSCAYCVLLQL
jgi:hypothetical protein